MPDTFTLAPKAQMCFPVIVTVPATATPGMYDQASVAVTTAVNGGTRAGTAVGAEVSWHGRSPFRTMGDANSAPHKDDFVDEQANIDWFDHFDTLKVAFRAGQVDEARQIIVDELQPRINGCHANGKPDDDDWIMSCRAQEKATASLNDLLMMLTMP